MSNFRMCPYIEILANPINCNNTEDDEEEYSPLYHVIVSQEALKMIFLVQEMDIDLNPKRKFETIKCEYISIHSTDKSTNSKDTQEDPISSDISITNKLYRNILEPYGIKLLNVIFHGYDFIETSIEGKGFVFTDKIKYEKLKDIINKKCIKKISS